MIGPGRVEHDEQDVGSPLGRHPPSIGTPSPWLCWPRMPEPAPIVTAVVVTYRRTDLLRGCIDALLSQTRPPDRILVIDNDEIAHTVAPDDPRVRVVETGENLGPAGGYEIGLRLAERDGAGKIWTVDDDVVPDPDCLERLLEASTPRSIVVPLQRKPGGVRGHPPSWNGGLIDAEVIREVGLPRRDLFFWAEDTEWVSRAKEAGIPRTPVWDAGVMHLNPEDRVRGQQRDWRLYYEVRNSLYWRLRMRDLSLHHLRRALTVAIGKPVAVILFEPGKAASLKLWWWGVRDFALGRLGKRVEPETWSGDTPANGVG